MEWEGGGFGDGGCVYGGRMEGGGEGGREGGIGRNGW